jgi:hypothetical protein
MKYTSPYRILRLQIIVILILIITSFNALSLSDSNLNNNIKSVFVNTTDTRPIRIQFVLVSNDSGAYSSDDLFPTVISQSILFMNTVYPVADDAVITNSSNIVRLDLRNVSPQLLSAQRRTALWLQLAKIGATSNPRPDRVVGILPRGTIDASLGGENAVGWAPIPGSSAFVEDHATDIAQHTVAHELGHTYGLCDEYSSFEWGRQHLGLILSGGCPNGDDNNNEFLDNTCIETDASLALNVTGCRAPSYKELNPFATSSETYVKNGTFDTFRNFMGDATYGADRYWTSASTYEYLLNQTRTDTMSHGKGILVSATIYKNGTYVLDNSYVLDDVDRFYTNDSGNYSIKLKSGANTLFHTNFSQSVEGAEGNLEESNLSGIVFILPYYENISSVEFQFNNQLQSTINASPHTPQITLTSPVGGETYLSAFNVSWTATDTDGANLTYFLQISADNGSAWQTVTVDLNSSTYLISNGDYVYGTQYKIRVYVSDGFNTNSTTSNAFTIIPPPRVTVDNITNIYSSGSKKIFDINVRNNGGQNLSHLAWQLNTNESIIASVTNSSLTVNELMTVLIEYNYSQGNLKNISFLAYDNNKSVNDSENMTIFVGDMRVRDIAAVSNATQVAFNFTIYNNGSGSITSINWTFRTGEANISATSLLSLSAYNATNVTVYYNYSGAGTYSLQAEVFDGFNNFTTTSSITIRDLEIVNFILLYQQNNRTVSTFSVINDLLWPVNYSWKLDTGEQNITSTNNFSLESQEVISVIIEHQYSTYANFTTIANVTGGKHSQRAILNIDMRELQVHNFQKLSNSSTTGIFSFDVGNLWNMNKTATWSFDTNNTGTVWATQDIALTPGENASIIIQNNFTTTGNYALVARTNTTTNYTASINATI